MSDQEQMTGAQAAAVARLKGEMVLGIAKDIELRKLALDQTCRMVEHSAHGVTPETFIEFAAAMHKFLSASAPD